MSCARVLVVFTAVFFTGCAGSPRIDSCPEPNELARLTPQYLIGAGDMLQIFVWRNPEISTTIPVRPDGRISTPLVSDMVAAGKTPSDLARDMEAVLSEYLRSPTVNVIVASPGLGSQIQVVGAVNVPQGVVYRESMRVLDVLLTAGASSPPSSCSAWSCWWA